MTKRLKNIGKMPTVTLIENQLVSAGFARCLPLADRAATPRGACARGLSIPLFPTLFSLLAMPEVSE
ncbi:MAG TPA: hypothetical protein DF966_09585 [Sulfitobacter sp.]|nr:hypothetical protein [Sulfitobacter sp.]